MELGRPCALTSKPWGRHVVQGSLGVCWQESLQRKTHRGEKGPRRGGCWCLEPLPAEGELGAGGWGQASLQGQRVAPPPRPWSSHSGARVGIRAGKETLPLLRTPLQSVGTVRPAQHQT